MHKAAFPRRGCRVRHLRAFLKFLRFYRSIGYPWRIALRKARTMSHYYA